MFIHRTKKLLLRSTIVGSDISYFHKQTRADSDQAALTSFFENVNFAINQSGHLLKQVIAIITCLRYFSDKSVFWSC